MGNNITISPYEGLVRTFQMMEKENDKVTEGLLYSFYDVFRLLAIRNSGKLVGLIHLNDKYDTVHIESIYILNEFRNKGIGSEVINIIKENSIGRRISACPYTNESEKLFLKHGFKPYKEDQTDDDYLYLVTD